MNAYDDYCGLWQYSKFYSDMLETIIRLREDNESLAAITLLFNLMEQVFKSVRETDEDILINDITWLYKNNLITKKEHEFLNDKKNGIRHLRNIMFHKDSYSYCIEINDVAYPFSDMNSWTMIFDVIFDDILSIIFKVLNHKTMKK